MNLNKGISAPIAIGLIVVVSAVAGVAIWQFRSPEQPSPKQASDYTAQSACEEAGYYWYDGSCHEKEKDTEVELPVPQAPSLTFLEGAEPSIQISWNRQIADYFNIYRATSPEGSWTKIVEQYPKNAGSAADYDYPEDAEVLYYKITSVNEEGVESKPSKVSSVELTGGEATNWKTDWKTYKNKGFGFEVKYPAEIFIISEKSGSITLKHEFPFQHTTSAGFPREKIIDMSLTFRILPKGIVEATRETYPFLVDNLPEAGGKLTEGFSKEVFVGEKEGYSFLTGAGGQGREILIIKLAENRTFFIDRFYTLSSYNTRLAKNPDFIANDKQVEVFYQMLSTLRFIEKKSEISEDWNTYRNEKYGFEVKYPLGWTTQESKNNDIFSLKISKANTPEMPRFDITYQPPGVGYEYLAYVSHRQRDAKFLGKDIKLTWYDAAPMFYQECDTLSTKGGAKSFDRLIDHKNKSYEIWGMYCRDDESREIEEILTRVLSTFKFID